MKTLASLLVLFALTATAQAQEYPTRLIKLMQGFPPGGNVEFVARLLANEMQKHLGQTIVVESKPGQAGSLAAETLATAEPDGHTLLLVAGAHPATAAVYKNLKYDPVDSFAWISTASFYPFIICVRNDFDAARLGRSHLGRPRKAGQRELGHGRKRLDRAYDDRAARTNGWPENPVGTLSRRGACGHRTAHRRYRLRGRHHLVGNSPCPVGSAQGARGHRQDPLEGYPGEFKLWPREVCPISR